MAYQVGVIDGFDHYDPATGVRKWGTLTGAVTTAVGPHYGQAVVFAGGGNFFHQDTAGSETSQGCSFALRVRAAGWGTTPSVCPVEFWLADVLKQTLLLHADGHLAAHMGDATGPLLAASAPGAVPFDRWVYVCYSSSLWESGPDASGPGGRVDVFVDGQAVLSEAGIATTELPHRHGRVKLGNCLDDGNAVTLEVDDFAHFFSFETEHPEPYPPDFTDPHTVLTLRPVGAGELTELGVGAGAGANWEVNAEAIGDGDASYVVKAAGTDQHDLYLIGPPAGTSLPALPPDEAAPDYWKYRAMAWGMLRDDGGAFGQGMILCRFDDPDGVPQEYSARYALGTAGYRFIGTGVGHTAPEVASLRVGYGRAADDVPDGLQDAFAGSQIVVELWYPAPAVAPPPGGGRRWSVGWLPQVGAGLAWGARAGGGNTIMYTQTTAPAGAENSLWFNPDESA